MQVHIRTSILLGTLKMRPLQLSFVLNKSEKSFWSSWFGAAFRLVEQDKCQWLGEIFEQIEIIWLNWPCWQLATNWSTVSIQFITLKQKLHVWNNSWKIHSWNHHFDINIFYNLKKYKYRKNSHLICLFINICSITRSIIFDLDRHLFS